ncbi:serine hydrolase [Streptomyces sp. NPDC007861]|uniref:serine hydrolase n=1 Tax=Streptomyces sp. NPDC007861 TaxID=3154893 RepID=UPI0033C40422
MLTVALPLRARRRDLVAGVAAFLICLYASSAAPLAASHRQEAPVTAPPAAQAHICTSAEPQLARQLERNLHRALSGNTRSVAVALQDERTHTRCAFRSRVPFDSASVVKVTILGALLHQTSRARRSLTAEEHQLAANMITRSDNAATSVLWNRIGRSELERFARAAGMHSTRFGPGGLWGLTQITAEDQLALLTLLGTRNAVLDETSRSYATDLMTHVVPEQRWGVTAGFAGSSPVAVKNGWLPRSQRHWRVHSIGTFHAEGTSYSLVILSDGNRLFSQGKDSIEELARIVHENLGKHRHHTHDELASKGPHPAPPRPGTGPPSARRPGIDTAA